MFRVRSKHSYWLGWTGIRSQRFGTNTGFKKDKVIETLVARQYAKRWPAVANGERQDYKNKIFDAFTGWLGNVVHGSQD